MGKPIHYKSISILQYSNIALASHCYLYSGLYNTDAKYVTEQSPRCFPSTRTKFCTIFSVK